MGRGKGMDAAASAADVLYGKLSNTAREQQLQKRKRQERYQTRLKRAKLIREIRLEDPLTYERFLIMAGHWEGDSKQMLRHYGMTKRQIEELYYLTERHMQFKRSHGTDFHLEVYINCLYKFYPSGSKVTLVSQATAEGKTLTPGSQGTVIGHTRTEAKNHADVSTIVEWDGENIQTELCPEETVYTLRAPEKALYPLPKKPTD